jgi:hypothetical protein
MKAIWPNVAGHIVSEQGWWTLASYVYKKHGPVKLFVVTDEKDKLVYVPGLQKANGIADPKHGYYNFKSIEWRKADRVSSATDLRAAVLEGSRKKFTQAAGVSSETPVMGKPFFDLVSEYLLPYKDQILASMARKAAKAAKKNEDAAGVGTITKQNSTADVNAGTPRKNLKAFHLVKETSSDLTADEMVAILSGQKTQQQVLADRSKPATSGSIPMDRWTKRAKDMLSRGMNEQQVIQQLVKDGLALRLAQQAVQAAQINETFLQELENAMLSEAGMKPIEKSYKASMKNASTLPALNMSTGSGGAYMNYRMSIALAGAPNYPTKMEADNWIGGDPLLSTYTEEEFDMIKQAAKQVGAGTIQNWSGKRSQEVADVNKTSTVAKIKKNKYGV